MGLIFLLLFSAVHDISRIFDFWTPKIPTATPREFVLSIFSTVHEIYRTFEMLTPNPPPPGTPRNPPGGMGLKKNILLIVWTVHDISRTFDFFTP